MNEKPDFQVRFVTAADWYEVERVHADAFNSLREIYRPNKVAQMRNAASFFAGLRLVLELDGIIAGTVQLGSQDDFMFLNGLAVDARFRRQGGARALVDAVACYADEQGFAAIELATIEQTGNVPIFENMGFHEVEREPADWCVSDRYDTLINVRMRRELKPDRDA